MKIINHSSGLVLSEDCKKVTSFTDKLLGLLKKDNPRTLIFETYFGVHTFFLKEPIDVLILDSNKRVRHIKEDLQPNKLLFWKPLYNIVIELPGGTIRKSKTKLGNIIDLLS